MSSLEECQVAVHEKFEYSPATHQAKKKEKRAKKT